MRQSLILLLFILFCAVVSRADPVYTFSTVDSGGTIGSYLSAKLGPSGVELIYNDATRTGLKHAYPSGSGWSYDWVDSLGNVGSYGSFCIDGDGRQSFTYLDDDQDMLKYAGWIPNPNPTYSSITVETGNIGSYLSAKWKPDGEPALCYYDAAATGLKYAARNGVSWDIQYVDSFGNVGSYGSFCVDNSGRQSFAFLNDDQDMLMYAGWISNPNPSYTSHTIETGNIGSYLDAERRGTMPTAVSYYDATLKKAKIATGFGTSWQVSEVPYSSTDYGKYSAIALSNDNRLGLSFLDDQRDSLIYATNAAPYGVAPVVTNVHAEQRIFPSRLLDIYYDVVHPLGNTMTISIQVSSNSGQSWTIPVTNASGDIGSGIHSGTNKHIVWDAGVDWPGMQSSTMKVRVMAND